MNFFHPQREAHLFLGAQIMCFVYDLDVCPCMPSSKEKLSPVGFLLQHLASVGAS